MSAEQAIARQPRSVIPLRPALLWAIAVIVVSVLVWLKPDSRTVYSIYAHAGRGWLEGRDMYSRGGGGVMHDEFRYSPLAAIGFAGLSQLPNHMGGILWRWLGVAALVAGFAYACRTIDLTWNEKTIRQRQWLWILILPLSIANLHNGQANLHVTGLLLVAVAAARDARWNLAAICLAMTCLVKVYPLALALLLITLYPRPLGLRFAVALTLGLGLPFLAHSPAFVLDEYRLWAAALIGDDRFLPTGTSYRDLAQLLQLAHVPVNRGQFFALQIALALAAALVCGFTQRRSGWEAPRMIRLAYSMGTFWMILCGPATESSTYILLAPLAAWLTVDGLRGEYSASAKWLIIGGVALIHLALASSAFPFYRSAHNLGLHPLGALVMLLGYLRAEFGSGHATDRAGAGPVSLQPAMAMHRSE